MVLIRGNFWFSVLLVPIAAIIVDVSVKCYWSIMHPSPNQVLREIEQRSSKGPVSDGALRLPMQCSFSATAASTHDHC